MTLTATADAGWTFAGFTGDASGGSPLAVTIDGNKSVTATFTQNSYTLTVVKVGNGTVVKDPEQASYHYGDVVTLTATADAGWTFAGFTGDASGGSPLAVTIDGNKSVTATFTQDSYSLTVATVGNGTVNLVPPGGSYTYGTVVSVSAVPATGWHFDSWSGHLTGSTNPTSLTMDGNKSITATFVVNPDVLPTTLTVNQLRTGNGPGNTCKVSISWPALPGGSTLELWRASYGHYPEFDDGGGSPVTTYPPEARWTSIATHLTGTTYLDAPSLRDYYYYVAYVTDTYGTRSPVSNQPAALDYFLGDVTNGVTPGVGDNVVNGLDVSVLGAHYGVALVPASDPLGYIDVGPTATHLPTGLPLTDNALDFEDLVIIAINYGGVSAPQLRAGPAAVAVASSDGIVLERPEAVALGDLVTATLTLRGSGTLRALSTKLAWDPAVVEPVGHAAGEWLTAHDGVAFSARLGTVDAAVLGAAGMSGEGVLATVSFKVLAAGDPKIRIEVLDGRDGANQKVTPVKSERLVARVPTVTQLALAQPNPFRGEAVLSFSLAQRGEVELALYSVDGRRVRTLVSGLREPGEYRPRWDGRDDHGSHAAAGVYYVQLVAGKRHFTRKLVYLR